MFRASRRLRFEDTKRIMSPEMRPKSFGTFEKRSQRRVNRLVRPMHHHYCIIVCLKNYFLPLSSCAKESLVIVI